jgi:hypothetical protein
VAGAPILPPPIPKLLRRNIGDKRELDRVRGVGGAAIVAERVRIGRVGVVMSGEVVVVLVLAMESPLLCVGRFRGVEGVVDVGGSFSVSSCWEDDLVRFIAPGIASSL